MLNSRNGLRGSLPVVCFLLSFSIWAQGTITTIAGTGVGGYSGDGGPAVNAQLSGPAGVAVDANGNVYFTDSNNGRVRKVSTNGTITTIAGCGAVTVACALVGLGDGGPATAPFLAGPVDVTVDTAGNVYFSDSGNQRIRKIDASGNLSTVAGGGTQTPGDGGPATAARLRDVEGIALDGLGNLYFTEGQGHRIRKIDASGTLTTIAGDGTLGFTGDGGPAVNARVNLPIGIAADSAGNVYIADTNNFRVRRINPAGIITTIAGNGTVVNFANNVLGTSTSLSSPQGVEVDSAGNLYIAEALGYRIRKLDTAGIITTVAGGGTNLGDGGPATSARFTLPRKVVIDAAGALYIADSQGNRIRKISSGPAAPPPTISSNGIVNGASFLPGIVPNSWATITGTGLAAGTATWDGLIVNGRLPTSLNGVSVTVDGRLAYPYFVSPTQINFIVPEVGAGPKSVVVTTPAGTSQPVTVTASLHSPAFFPWPNDQVVATRADFTFAANPGTFPGATTAAAKPGEVIILWGTGFGPTSPTPTAGFQVPSDRTYSTATPPSITINNINATVYGAALAPGFVGLYQIAIQVPEALADGTWPIRAAIGGVESPATARLAVKR